MEKFYIGKTHVRQKSGGHGGKVKFDHMKSGTWKMDNGINSRWKDHKRTDYGRDGLVVLTVVTKDAINPDIREKYPDFHQEHYALALERRLIQDYMTDSRLENKTLEPGRRDSSTSIGYALYMTFKVSMLFSNSYLIVYILSFYSMCERLSYIIFFPPSLPSSISLLALSHLYRLTLFLNLYTYNQIGLLPVAAY